MSTVYDRPKTNVAKRRPRKPGLGNIAGTRDPKSPTPGGRERQKPVRPGKPGNPGGRERTRPGKPIGPTKPPRPPRKPGKGGKTGTWKPLKPGGLTKDTPGGIAGGRGKVAKPRRMKKRVMY